MTQLRILLVDDHEVVRLGLKALLQRHEYFNVVAEAGTEQEAVDYALQHQPDIVLMDIRLAGGSGIVACEKIMQHLPDTRVVMLTSYADEDLLFAAIRAGAFGYVLKQIGNQELIRAVEAAGRGESTLDPSLTQKMFTEMRRSLREDEMERFSELTPQEMKVLAKITDGSTNREIASALFLSEGTIRNYVSNILSKLNVSNRAEAAAYAVEHHLRDHLQED